MSSVTPEAFFLEHASFSYDPNKETEEQGKQRCAQALADAEAWAQENGARFVWEIDADVDSSDHSDEEPAYALWSCLLYMPCDQCPTSEPDLARKIDGCAIKRSLHAVQSLSAVDFGRDAEPCGQPYKRVVEAELALEQQAQTAKTTEPNPIVTDHPRQAIVTKYSGPTNTRGSRIYARASAGSVSVECDDALNMDDNHTAAARKLCQKFGWKLSLSHGVLANGDHVFVQMS